MMKRPPPRPARPPALPLQTREAFDAAAVLRFLKTCPHGGDAPQQGWLGLVEEACHRIARLEASLAMVQEARERHAWELAQAFRMAGLLKDKAG